MRESRVLVRAVVLISATMALALQAGMQAQAQDDAGVCVDGRFEHNVVVVPNINVPQNSCPTFGAAFNLHAFLSQGRRSQLRVVNRKFMTDYTVTIDGSTNLQTFRIQDLDEAASLTIPLSASPAGATTPASKGAVVSKGAGGISTRSPKSVLLDLNDPGNSTLPASEILADWNAVQIDIKNITIDLQSFAGTWNSLNGTPPVGANGCLAALGNASLTSSLACLNARLNEANLVGPADESRFQQLVTDDNDAIAMMNSLSIKLQQMSPHLATQLSALQGDLSTFQGDANLLAQNIRASQDAVNLADSLTPELTKSEIKMRLSEDMNGAAKLDPAELNELTDELYAARGKKAAREVLVGAKTALTHAMDTIAAELANPTSNAVPGNCSNKVDTVPACIRSVVTFFQAGLSQESGTLYTLLPASVDQVNAAQSTLLARTNQIYDLSTMLEPLDKIIDLSSISGNAYVGFTVRRVEYFSRFAVPPLTVSGNVTPAPSVPAPASAVGAAGATTTTTATTTTGTTTTTMTAPATSASSGSAGTVVGHGYLELHDVYRATVVAAFAFSAAGEAPNLTTTNVTTGTSTDGTNSACSSTTPCSSFTQANGSHTHTSVILGLTEHFLPYDTFPHAYKFGTREYFRHSFGVFGGLSVQNLNDYYLALSYQVLPGVEILGGGNFYRQTAGAASGYAAGTIYTGTQSFTGSPSWLRGPYFGLGLNLSIFRKIFGSATGLATTATSTTGS